ncbi:hypothetical protein [Parasegetibacter sp. NRK P23]|uniref:hypothetical protein n=1 Tax=Parasegetibacter sp. NRK P23 TaxID=2942999 RepID=UPI0020439F39|nr:hypothetical protein [Parasegetibacter sp. NRK P23]MCM5527897.1 hypothetical protein [Parasegetibacter sp. NRK P23]
MAKKYIVLLCTIISMALLFIAAYLYPGGSIQDKNSIGFIWNRNFISNLFGEKALNGADNASRIWAIIGMAFHAIGNGIFFLHTAQKMPSRHAALVLKIVGYTNMLFSFLIVTPWHDSMVTISSTLSLLGLFYITVFILRTKLHLLKVACILFMLMFYYTLFLYGSGDWIMLAIMQKVSLICSMILVLWVEYFTKKEDFMVGKKATLTTAN